jgi:S1-C subfamily serine protease
VKRSLVYAALSLLILAGHAAVLFGQCPTCPAARVQVNGLWYDRHADGSLTYCRECNRGKVPPAGTTISGAEAWAMMAAGVWPKDAPLVPAKEKPKAAPEIAPMPRKAGLMSRMVSRLFPWKAALKVRSAGFGGSGTCVRSGKVSLVLTNAHVVEGGPGEPWAVDTTDGRSFAAAVAEVCPFADLALVRVDGELPAVELADEDPTGTSIRRWGFPLGRLTPKGGRLLGLTGGFLPGRANCPVAEIDEPSVSGDSGSGLFDPRGRLVGVVWGGGPGRSSTVPLAEVRRFLAPHLAD